MERDIWCPASDRYDRSRFTGTAFLRRRGYLLRCVAVQELPVCNAALRVAAYRLRRERIVSADADSGVQSYGPWNPGVRSPVPQELRPHCTIFLPANVFTDFGKAAELRDLTGLEMSEIVAFRPRRLVLHELLIRVTADLSVPDGQKVEDLGRNFRQMTRVILARYIEPHMDALSASFDATRRQLAQIIEAEVAAVMPAPTKATIRMSPPAKPGLFSLFSARRRPAAVAAPPSRWDELVRDWATRGDASGDELSKAAYGALARVLAAILKRHGGTWGTAELITSLATDVASNEYGSDLLGGAIAPLLLQAARSEGYSLLPAKQLPVIMNTKGPSASGKSTLRPLQKQLASAIGVDWSDFALISPDIWRKQLLDYDALGANYKYAGSFTGEELQIVDQKLDRYMARKAERGQISHLLIDRFRFDSFAEDSDEAGSNLLTRFGRIIYLFFMITPPGLLVERAWNRGLDVGRYKAVDDTLAHGVEAYTGMPQLFFTWVQRADKRVHFEFLDNSVQRGERPRTVAFGENDTMNVLDVKCILDIERHRRANINATAARFLHDDPALLAPEKNVGFLRQCVARFHSVNFADQDTGRMYLSIVSGTAVWADGELLARSLSSADTRAALDAVAPTAASCASADARPKYLQEIETPAHSPTLGRWGSTT